MAELSPIDALRAMSARHIPCGESGLWKIDRRDFTSPWAPMLVDGRERPPGIYTFLWRYTMSSAHREGECVMSDDPIELSRHLEFVLQARGRVLITGLGLGCVLRGALANPAVDHVDLVERDPHVIRLVWPHCDQERVTLHQADALEWLRTERGTWDAAWHDLWSDPDAKEERLSVTHQKLILELRGRVGWQGAWALPRHIRRVLREQLPDARAWGNA